MTNEEFMKLAIKEAQRAAEAGEIPVGAIIVRENVIISKGFNKKEKKKNPIMHAEIIAIQNACRKLESWRLSDCLLFVTMEPCLMCVGAIIESRIQKVVCGIKNDKYHSLVEKALKENNISIEYGIMERESLELMKSFFIKERKNK
jgi:tRNA(adenine34) deaminase